MDITDKLHGNLYTCMTALVLMLTGVMLLLLHELANSVLLCGHFCVHNTGFKLGRVTVWYSKCLFQDLATVLYRLMEAGSVDVRHPCWCIKSHVCFYTTLLHTTSYF